MVDPRNRSLIVLARVQTVIDGLVAVSVVAIYALQPSLLTNFGASFALAILSTAGVVYFLTLHQIIGRKRLALSTLILTIISASNFAFVIATTGGLDSPYYSLWLLAIVVAGLFGTMETIVILSVTVAYFVAALLVQGLHAHFVMDHLAQLVITIAAAGVAEWVHARGRRASVQNSKLETLSGELNTEQFKAQALMSSIGEGVMVINANRQIQLFNPAAQTLTGWDESSAQNIAYGPVLQLRDAADAELTEVTDPFTEAWTKKQPVVRDNLVLTTRSGRKTAINLSISPMFDAAGAPNGAIALFRDISREKAIERQKDEFVSTASHEMRTPVAAIEGYIALAMNPNVATIDDRAKKYLDKAHDTIKHLGELFRDLLSITKAEEGNLQLKMEAVNVGELIQSAVDDMQFTAQQKGLTLVYQFGNTAGKSIAPIYYVAANGERLREVVMNLIDNAVKFTAAGGIRVSLGGNDKEVAIEVSDTGLGIAPEDIDHLFQKFYRIDSSATRTIGGTGLGLYLCRTIIELFSGRIWVTSKLGQGSVFHITVPRLSQDQVRQYQQQTPAAAAPDAAAVPAPATPGTVIKPAPSAGPAIAPAPIPMPVPGEQIPHPDLRRVS